MKVKLFIILISILFTACASNEASNNANDDFAETESVSTTEIERPYIPDGTPIRTTFNSKNLKKYYGFPVPELSKIIK